MREIGSAAVESLTSAGLQDFKAMIADASRQRREIEVDLAEAQTEFHARQGELSRKKKSLFRVFFKKRIAELTAVVPRLSAEIERLEAWLEATHIEVHFDTNDAAQRAYSAVVRGYEALRACASIWDVTSDRHANRIAERTTATRHIDRRRVSFEYSKSELVRFSGQALRLANANGEDILIYPGMILMQRADGAFALLDLRDVQLKSEPSKFIESEEVPTDARVVGKAWFKANKDGSPDRRFNNNYQLPVCLYGQMTLTSQTGLTEEYQISNTVAAMAFGQAFNEYQAALRTASDQRAGHIN